MKLLTIFAAICSAIAFVEARSSIEPSVEEVSPRPVCDIMCTMQYDPVCCLPRSGCGDCQTFGNACGLDVYNCENPGNPYYSYSNGDCGSIGKGTLVGQLA
ncbi:vasotab-like [Bradysia coprophila]|uniref:vasotab-like n=1 Tax=Bradysia coprophila TaxID=38358 RepID=UPI00187DA271|nr:vasotab-like [Bradysia coprophila]